jgi:iron complex transport system ATP-binding protein
MRSTCRSPVTIRAMPALLAAEGVHFAFGVTPVLRGVSLDVGRGTLVGILGPNGSGKTTLLRLLAGTLRPSDGRVLLDGEDLSRISRAVLARRFAVVPQETQLAFEYTALEIALMGRYPHLGAFEVEGPGDLASAMAALDATGTAHLAERTFQTLSGGEKQRVIIASALAQLDTGEGRGQGQRAEGQGQRPDGKGRLLLLDEPTASLDLRYQIEVFELVQRLHDRGDISIVLSTHDLHFAAAVCAEVVLLREGKVLAHGPTASTLSADRVHDLYGVGAHPLFAGQWQ